jgi:superfamily II DNA/RNA helicase
MLQTCKWQLLPERSLNFAIGERWGSGSLCRFYKICLLLHSNSCVFVDFFCFLQIMVPFSSCNSVKFHSELLNYIDIPCLDFHGKQKHQKRTSTYFEFCNAEKGILLCTDVAARGLDIPAVVCFLTKSL